MDNHSKSGREKFKNLKPIFNVLIKCVFLFPYKLRLKLLEHYRMTKGNKGLVIRYILLKSIAQSCGDNVSIQPDVYLFKPEKLSIGDNVSIHPMCYIDATGGINIGNNVSIAHGTTILSLTHQYKEIYIPIKYQQCILRSVIIKDNVWIGAKASILAGITVGSGSIVGAGAVVTKNISENEIVGGVPAKVLKERSVVNEDTYIE